MTSRSYQADRNLLVLIDSMRGRTLRDIAMKYEFSVERARQIVLTEYYRRWPDVYLQHPTGRLVCNGGRAPFPSAKIPGLRRDFESLGLERTLANTDEREENESY